MPVARIYSYTACETMCMSVCLSVCLSFCLYVCMNVWEMNVCLFLKLNKNVKQIFEGNVNNKKRRKKLHKKTHLALNYMYTQINIKKQ